MAVQEFLSSNKNRAYPFVEDSNLGNLPRWLLLEFRLINCAAASNGTVVCTGFSKNSEEVTMHFEYVCGENNTEFSIPVRIGSHVSIGSVTVDSGVVVKFAVYGGGSEYSFDVEDGSYELNAKIIGSRILEISRESTVSSFAGVAGVIHVVDGHNTIARTVNNIVYIDVKSNGGLGEDCNVPDDAFDCKKALMFINGQHADTAGNINITGGTGVVVQTGRNASVGGSLVPAITIRHDGSLKGTV